MRGIVGYVFTSVRVGALALGISIVAGACTSWTHREVAAGARSDAVARCGPQDPGKLQRAQDKASASGTSSSARSHGSSPGSNRVASLRYDDDDDDDVDDLWKEPALEIIGFVLTLPWTGVHVLMEGEKSSFGLGYYLRHPYASDEDPMIARFVGSDVGKRSAIRLRSVVDYGNDFGDIQRLGASLRLDTALRVGLDASWSHYWEELEHGPTDELDLGDVNLVLRFAQSSYGEMRSGVGLNWLEGTTQTELGFNFTYAGDFYIGDPWTTSFEIDWGRVGAAERFHGRATVGAVWEGFELQTGFDYESIDSVGLPSWIVGLRVWF